MTSVLKEDVGRRIKGLLGKLLPLLLIIAAFVFFVTRSREKVEPEKPEDVLIKMAIALGEGDIQTFLGSFGGDLEIRLRTIVEREGERRVSAWLKERGQRIKGFAILDQRKIDSSILEVKTETVYEDRNNDQTFVLQLLEGRWRIIRSDFEMVTD